jgi:nucleotide-binding universal stress UspA family protein
MAAWLADEIAAPLEFVHVFDPGAQPALPRDGVLIDPVLRDTLDDRHDKRERALAHATLEELAVDLGRPDAATLVLEGQVLPTLFSYAVERRALLLVSGTAARAGLDHVLQGSVSSRLAAEARCPVVTVPPSAAVAQDGPLLVGDDGSDHA